MKFFRGVFWGLILAIIIWSFFGIAFYLGMLCGVAEVLKCGQW